MGAALGSRMSIHAEIYDEHQFEIVDIYITLRTFPEKTITHLGSSGKLDHAHSVSYNVTLPFSEEGPSFNYSSRDPVQGSIVVFYHADWKFTADNPKYNPTKDPDAVIVFVTELSTRLPDRLSFDIRLYEKI
jgi:hypothetical protein